MQNRTFIDMIKMPGTEDINVSADALIRACSYCYSSAIIEVVTNVAANMTSPNGTSLKCTHCGINIRRPILIQKSHEDVNSYKECIDINKIK